MSVERSTPDDPSPSPSPPSRSLTDSGSAWLQGHHRLSCGHTSDEHAATDARDHQRVDEFIGELRARRLKPVPAYELSPTQFWQHQREASRSYFLELSRKQPRRYLYFVKVYELAHEPKWAQLPCQRGRLPLNPREVEGLPKAPRTLPPQVGQGGRPPSDIVRDRDTAIVDEWTRHPVANNKLAGALDSRGVTLPPEFRRDGLTTWMMAYRREPRRFSRYISRVRRRAAPESRRRGPGRRGATPHTPKRSAAGGDSRRPRKGSR